jgi:hypothetical protein
VAFISSSNFLSTRLLSVILLLKINSLFGYIFALKLTKNFSFYLVKRINKFFFPEHRENNINVIFFLTTPTCSLSTKHFFSIIVVYLTSSCVNLAFLA